MKDSRQFEDIHYKTNYLTEVIARVDLAGSIAEIGKRLPRKLTERATRSFRIAEPREILGEALQISAREVERAPLKLTEWHFHGENREKTLTITRDSVFIKYTSYDSYEVLRQDFLPFLEEFFAHYTDAQGKRLGLRYINQVHLQDGAPLDWGDYLGEMVLPHFGSYPETKSISRDLHTLEYNFGDHSLRYQFGMHNPDYPAPIRRKVYVLDLDAYSQGPQEYDDIERCLDGFHSKIQALFELSITDELRKLMNDGK